VQHAAAHCGQRTPRKSFAPIDAAKPTIAVGSGLINSTRHDRPVIHPSGVSRFPENSRLVSTSYRADFTSRGIVGPRHIIDIEIGIADPPKPVDPAFQVKTDILFATIPDDLSIPNFLRRRS
jgi:hypothetical protein